MIQAAVLGYGTVGSGVVDINGVIEAAKADTTRPSFITVKTEIGYGCPAKEGKASAHGDPLGVENVAALRENLNWESKEDFFVPEDVYANYKELAKQGADEEAAWNKLFDEYASKYPEMKQVFQM